VNEDKLNDTISQVKINKEQVSEQTSFLAILNAINEIFSIDLRFNIHLAQRANGDFSKK
jgi:hypothetical protein